MIGLRICPWSMFLSFFTADYLTQVPVAHLWDRGSWVSRNTAGGLACLEMAAGPISLPSPEPWCGLPALLDVAIKVSQRVGLGQVCWWVVTELGSKVYLMGGRKQVEMREKRNTKSTLQLQKLEVLACLACLQRAMYWNRAQRISAWKNGFSDCKKNQYSSTCVFKAHRTHAVRIFRTLFLIYKIALIFFIFEEVCHAINIA